MNTATNLAPEWERLDVLATCVALDRRGEEISETLQARLQALHNQVLSLRQEMPWQALIQERHLTFLDQDILACALSPDAEPRLGWIYQELQPGISSPYPTPALIQELYFMDGVDAPALHSRFNSNAPLVQGKLVELVVDGAYAPVRPTAKASNVLLGWSVIKPEAPPGTVEITADGDWDDLVLPEYCLRGLREFLLWNTHRERVFEEWGGKRIGGPVALFTGPSGTGKTFSSVVLANALGWPLYRVDLGMLVSKYVGETEKNFNALFDAAHNQTMVLLFDEAESLFGKRGEVREARDRFANMEVSHLLSRIERHQGPCILTSNLREHLDSAFARRFQIVVEFPRPDTAARIDLWRNHLPPKAPYDANVDVNMLGETLKLTGGQIRNAALHAAFLAAGEDSSISLNHIAQAVWTELAKEGKEVISSSLGDLAAHLDWRPYDTAH